MDIVGLSMALSMNQTMTDVSVAVLDMSLETIENMGDGMTKIMEQSINPELGQNIDIRL